MSEYACTRAQVAVPVDKSGLKEKRVFLHDPQEKEIEIERPLHELLWSDAKHFISPLHSNIYCNIYCNIYYAYALHLVISIEIFAT